MVTRAPFVVALLLTAALACSCSDGSATKSSAPNASTRRPVANSPAAAHHDFAVESALRLGCGASGSSHGFAVTLAVSGHRGQSLVAAAYSSADARPYVSTRFTPDSADWRGVVRFSPLVAKDQPLGPGSVHMKVGVSIEGTDQRLSTSPVDVVVPAASKSDCG